MEQFPKSEGGAWPNREKNSEKHPDHKGYVAITDDQLKMLIEIRKKGFEPRLQLALWHRKSKAGAPYLFVGGEVYMPKQAREPEPEPQWQEPPRRQAPPQSDGFSDPDIPF